MLISRPDFGRDLTFWGLLYSLLFIVYNILAQWCYGCHNAQCAWYVGREYRGCGCGQIAWEKSRPVNIAAATENSVASCLVGYNQEPMGEDLLQGIPLFPFYSGSVVTGASCHIWCYMLTVATCLQVLALYNSTYFRRPVS